ncbi:MAG: endonuclease/exonuclease/phosphatase family protein [Nitrospirae bacterium]|nr:endonuclease/exonuclease/phosphatase family protein [Nitrospirota bacterium]
MLNLLDGLDSNDSILRRIEMVRLIKTGVRLEEVCVKFDAAPEYVMKLVQCYEKNKTIGILTEEDFAAYRSANPELIKVCTFNLHGTHKDNSSRPLLISRELSSLAPDICAFQEAIQSGGEDTAGVIAKNLSHMTGRHYRAHFALCHLFMDKYPEGVAAVTNSAQANKQTIDLNKGLEKGLKPSMARFASACEVRLYGKEILFASVHLDYNKNKSIRLAQAKKLLKEIDRLYKNKYYCQIIAGDFNDNADSPAMLFLAENGFNDAYRHCNATGGATYPSDAPTNRIDYIMVKGDAEIQSSSLVLKNPELSDHCGVFAVLR